MKKSIILILLFALLSGCANTSFTDNGKINVVATTTMVADLVSEIGADYINLIGLMEIGVDPHLYQAKASDAETLYNANVVVYNGVHLEAKLAEVLGYLDNTISLENGLVTSELITITEQSYDPHIWFSINLWKKAAQEVAEELSIIDPENADGYQKNLELYLIELDDLKEYATKEINKIPLEQRILVTAHDAFAYFAEEFNFEVKAIQGISTQAEASTSVISDLADYIVENQIPAIFSESSISPKTITSLQDAVRSRGYQVLVGEELYSDSLKQDSNYLETFRANVDAIVSALKQG
ncbi:MAG: metal ABC transporter solute-binding protein, Zn/Mn family [Erysipelotrichaceae bacterium]